MNKVFEALLELLYPSRCIICTALLKRQETELCESCRKALPTYRGAERSGEFFTRCIAPFYYEGALRDSIRRFKFRGCSHYAAPYGKLLAMELLKKGAVDFDVLTWVPVSAKRKRKRGYDQAMLLARAVAGELNVPLTRTLVKHKNNPAQSGLADNAMRRGNVQGVYRPYQPESFRGKKVLLVDDICTSGATLSECSRMLLTAGAGEVACAVLAVAHKKV